MKQQIRTPCGHSFWQRPRKVFAIPFETAGSLAGKRKLSADQTSKSEVAESVMSEQKKMREDITKLKGAKEGENSTEPLPLAKYVANFLSTLPAAACSKCESVIGCILCVEQWRQAESTCPLCRADQEEYNKVPILREIQQVLREVGEDVNFAMDNE